jgi:amino acid permease
MAEAKMTDTTYGEKRGGRDDPDAILPSHPETMMGECSDVEKRKAQDGVAKFSRLGWKRLTILLMITAIALGTLSLPAAFASLGMVVGVLVTVVAGLIAVYTGLVVGEVKIQYPEVHHFSDAGRLLFGRVGYEVFTVMLVLQLLFLVGSHCLTGTTALLTIIDKDICSVWMGLASAAILLVVSIPPSFAEIAVLGYIDFASILITIGITIIATGIHNGDAAPSEAAKWSVWPREGITVVEAFIAVLNIIFAYSFTLCQFSFMDEMHTPKDFKKSIWLLGTVQVTLYTLTGALIYAFVGEDVKSPALLSAGKTVSRVAFGVAIPVIFISGTILVVTAGRMIHGRIYADTVTQYVNTQKGWITWLMTIAIVVVAGWLIAEVIPIFNDLVALISSLLNSGFALYFPAMFWFRLLKKGSWRSSKNIFHAICNALIMAAGFFLLVGGTYAVVSNIVSHAILHPLLPTLT